MMVFSLATHHSPLATFLPFAFLFSGPLLALATAVGAGSVPVLIHLFSRRRYRIVPWAAMRFLMAAQKQNVRRLRLEQYLLLALRVLMLLLVVLAMASVMPWAEAVWQRLFPEGSALAAPGSLRAYKILVLDGSFSMGAKAEERTAFERAKNRARQILDESPRGDGFSVVLMAAPPQQIVAEAAEDPHRVGDEVAKLRLPHGTADLPATLAAVEDLLKRTPGKYEAREVYFLTDMQRSTWLPGAGRGVAEAMHRIQDLGKLVFVDVGKDAPGNLAVTDLTLAAPLATTGVDTPITATVRNFGGDERKQVRAELLVGRARATAADPPMKMVVAAQQIVAVPAGKSSVAVTFLHRFTVPGDYALQVRIDGDALDLDDVRTLIATVREGVPVLVVDGKPAAGPLAGAADFLAPALNPFAKEKEIPRNLVARPHVVSLAEFNHPDTGDLTPYDCVFLCDVGLLGPGQVQRLEAHLRQGGGVVCFLGPQVNLDVYNRLAFRNGEGFLPGRLLGYQRSGPERVFTLAADEESMKQPPLQAFAADTDRLGVLAARFRQYMHVELPQKTRARKVLTFLPELRAEDKAPVRDAEPLPAGDPAVIDYPFHRGRVVLVTTTANREWNSWPGSPSYLPLVQEIFLHAVSGRLHGHAATVGDALEQFLPVGSGKLDVAIQTPDGRNGKTQAVDSDEGPLFRWSETDQSGLYRATVGALPREYLFAVNVPEVGDGQDGSESDLARLDRTTLGGNYTGWDFQLVADPKEVVHATAATTTTGPAVVRGVGPAIARWLLFVFFGLILVELVLAWKLGRAGKVAGVNPPTTERWLPPLVAGLALLVLLGGAGVLLHNAATDDFLGFMPDGLRRTAEALFGIPAPVAGESSHWRLESSRFLPASSANEPWLLALVALGSVGLVGLVYFRENATARPGERFSLAALRILLVLLTLGVLLPELQVWFERQGWPDVAVIVDDSGSMATVDAYQDPKVKEAAEHLATAVALGEPQRLQLAQALLARPDGGWLVEMLARRKVKLHVYHFDPKNGERVRLADVTEPGQDEVARTGILGLKPEGERSRLGDAVRGVLGDFRGAPLSAVVLLTDGVTTEGEDLTQASRYAAQAGVPLYFVGIGDDHEVRDLYLHDLQVEDAVFVNDRLVFEARLTAQGYKDLPPLNVTLYEKRADGQLNELTKVKVTPDSTGKPVKFRLTHQPTEAGEKTYVLDVPAQPDEVKPADNNRLERTVLVREAKPARVLYIEGYPRYDFRFVKILLEREAANAGGNRTIDLRVLLLDADAEYASQDRSALSEFPTREELRQFDVVILGDVDPKHPKLGDKNIDLLVDFVRERGGGLLCLAGEQHNPHSFKNTKLAEILPIVVTGDPPEKARLRTEAFKPQLTAVGRLHPIFRFSPEEAENQAVWEHLAGLYWYAEGYRLQPAAEVLAVHPQRKAAADGVGGQPEDLHPLVVQHFVGSGRCIFLGIDETWRWRFREDELRFNQFWIQAIKYLARGGLGRIDLRLNRQTPYRRGEAIQVTVRFPDDVPPPAADAPVKVVVEYRRKGALPGEMESQTLQLTKLEGSRATYEAFVNQTPEGNYRFWLNAGGGGPKPHAEALVLSPPGEMDRLRMNAEEMAKAAEETHGKFYTLAEADRLPAELPNGSRVTLSTPGPPWLLWNHPLLFVLLVVVLGAEWVLRKRKHLV